MRYLNPAVYIVPWLLAAIAHAVNSDPLLSIVDNKRNNEEPKQYLNLTALNGVEGKSALECWQLGPFMTSSTPGQSGSLALFLGEASNATYTVLPPRFDGGLHTAPAVQYVFFTTGLAHITLPHSNDEAWVQGGKYGLIIAADTPDVSEDGHITTYPSNGDTIGFVVPAKDGIKPRHELLHNGACKWEEMAGI